MNRKMNFMGACSLVMTVLVGLVFFPGCSEDEIVILPDDPSVELSGIFSDGETPLADAVVTAYQAEPPNTIVTSTDTDDTGKYTANVISGVSTHLKFDKLHYVVMNTRYETFIENTSGLDFATVLAADAEMVIDTAFDGMGLDLAGKAWLAIDVEDAAGDDVAGVSITPDSSPAGGGALNCDGSYSGGNITADPACPDRTAPMYLAYYDADAEIIITITGSPDISAPVRMGEVTIITVEQ